MAEEILIKEPIKVTATNVIDLTGVPEDVKEYYEGQLLLKQDKYDPTLLTASKEVGGAVNELKQQLDQIFEQTEEYISEQVELVREQLTEDIEDIEEQTSNSIARIQQQVNESVERIEGEVAKGIGDVRTDVEVLKSAFFQTSLLYKRDVRHEYDGRVTADGLPVINGSDAVLKKVEGNTVACKNLIPYPYIATTVTRDGLTYTDNGDGSVTVKGTATKASTFPLCEIYFGKESYFGSVSGGSNGYYFFQDCWYDKNNNTTFVRVNNGETIDKTFYPMVHTGTETVSYVPYFKGLKNASFAGIESTGKNIWNGTWEVGGINLNNGETIADGSSLVSSFVKVAPNASIAISGISATYELCMYDRNKSFVRRSGSWNPKSVKLADNEFYIRIYHYLDKNPPTQTQVEYGTVATEYEPYRSEIFSFPKTPTPLGTTIDFETQKIVEGSTEIVFNGTEDWSVRSIDSSVSDGGSKHRFGVALPKVSIGESSNINSVSSVYPSVSPDKSWHGTCGVAVDGSNVYLFDGAFATKTAEEFKDHIAELYASGNPLTIRYLLATPIETDFTEAQISAGNKYPVYNKGMEKVLGNENAEFGAINTLTVNYILVKE